MDKNLARIFVENRAEENMVKRLYSDYLKANQISVDMCWFAATALSMAASSLLRFPENPVVVILNATDREKYDELQESTERILTRAASRDKWHVAVVVPDITTWLISDPKFQSAAFQRPLKDKISISVYFGEWSASGNRINRNAISQANPDFQQLDQFLERKIQRFQQVA